MNQLTVPLPGQGWHRDARRESRGRVLAVVGPGRWRVCKSAANTLGSVKVINFAFWCRGWSDRRKEYVWWVGRRGTDNAWMEALETTARDRARMSRQKSRNTQVELALRRALHAAGLRFRVHRRPVKGVRREADVLFGPARVAVFVDGCFWHGCPEHATWPRRNAEFWRIKIEGNRVRDADTDEQLRQAGWLAIRVWEHESPLEAAERVRAVVEERRGRR